MATTTSLQLPGMTTWTNNEVVTFKTTNGDDSSDSDEETTFITALSTTDNVSSTQNQFSGLCVCACVARESRYVVDLKLLKESLIMKKNETSHYRRSLTSAYDARLSVRIIGYSSIVLLLCVVLSMIAIDIDNLIRSQQNKKD